MKIIERHDCVNFLDGNNATTRSLPAQQPRHLYLAYVFDKCRKSLHLDRLLACSGIIGVDIAGENRSLPIK